MTSKLMGVTTEADTGTRRGGGRTIAAGFLAALMMLMALSLWTIVPLIWLWIGSKVAATQFPSLGPYVIVLVGVVATIMFAAWVLGWMNELYLNLTGTHTVDPIRLGWLRSLRDSEAQHPPTLLEFVVVGSVLLAATCLLFWFLFFAGSPLPTG